MSSISKMLMRSFTAFSFADCIYTVATNSSNQNIPADHALPLTISSVALYALPLRRTTLATQFVIGGSYTVLKNEVIKEDPTNPKQEICDAALAGSIAGAGLLFKNLRHLPLNLLQNFQNKAPLAICTGMMAGGAVEASKQLGSTMVQYVYPLDSQK